eukprot:TRINITY_DN9369_c0_g1_i1.p1 TRINITY_DN9369_c0_g1~~TRINITY_DN9369_c0_g1_i1.p1  ORF type:complete len:642 (-),score=85.91 TRINITY_DN9369_c0_g1_i1:465-2390(-)
MKFCWVLAFAFFVVSDVSALVAHGRNVEDEDDDDNDDGNDDDSLPYLSPTTTTIKPTAESLKRSANTSSVKIQAGHLRCTKENKGAGYLMYSKLPVNERWQDDTEQSTFRKHTAFNLVCVRFHQGKWQYDRNWLDEKDRSSNVSWHYFTVRTDDVGVARLDFTANTVTSMVGKQMRYEGMQMGYVKGDIKFQVDSQRRCKYHSSGNLFYPWPATFSHVAAKGKAPVPLQPKNQYLATTGVFRCSDEKKGKGFIMFSKTAVNKRWNADKVQDDFRKHTAKNFVCVRYDTQEKRWQYDSYWASEPDRDSNKSWHYFIPVDTDMVVAAIDYEKEEIKDLKGVHFKHSNLSIGYQLGDIKFFMFQNAKGQRQRSYYRMTGHFLLGFDRDPPPVQRPRPGIVTKTVDFVHKDKKNRSISCTDENSTTGFIMFSPQPLATRLNMSTYKLDKDGPSKAHLQEAMKKGFTCVRFKNHRWQYDAYWTSNHSWHTFIPNVTDIVIASVNYKTNAVTLTQGTNVRYAGMQMGYGSGNIKITSTKGPNKNERIFYISGQRLFAYTNESMVISPPPAQPTKAPGASTTTTTTTTKSFNPYSTTVYKYIAPFFTTTSKMGPSPTQGASANLAAEPDNDGEDDGDLDTIEEAALFF